MRQPDGSEIQPVFLQLYHGNHKGTYKRVSPSREGWIVFDVLGHLRQWRTTSSHHPNKKIKFYIVTYNSLDDLSKDEKGKNCSESSIQFDQGVEDDDLKPLLMIYSHDFDIVRFNVSALTAAAEEDSDNHAQRRQASSTTATTTQQPDAMSRCRKHELQIGLSTFNRIWHTAQVSQTAIYPSTFNINVCGGDCERHIPSLMTAQNAIILYYLHTNNHQTPISNTVWGQCCAPVRYRSIDTLFSLPESDGEVRIITLKDISVKECSCLSILDRAPSRAPSR